MGGERRIIYLAGGSEERETAQTQALHHLVSRLDLKVTKLLKFVFQILERIKSDALTWL